LAPDPLDAVVCRINHRPMKTLGQIASYVGGQIYGDPSASIERLVHPALVEADSDLALILSPNAVSFLASGRVKNVILPAEVGSVQTPNRIVVSRPRLALAKLLELFERPVHVAAGIHPTAVIDPAASVGENVAIGPFCWVGPNSRIGDRVRMVCHVSIGADAVIGEGTLLHPGVCVGDRCKIGNRVIVQSNACIGGDGFAYVTPEPGSIESARRTGAVTSFNEQLIRINSIGNVVIEDDVEIGANTCIDRGTLGETRLCQSAKLDNLVQVAHNVTIGKNCMIVAQVGMGGSAKVGDRAVVGGQAGLPDHLNIGNDALVQAQAGLTKNVPERAIVIGSPAVPKREFLQREFALKRLPKLVAQVKELQAQVAALTEKVNSLNPER
jgi:UDP-3-O-[3-hydroxymyristoyl] glucosamine N-acyltransferase